MCWVIDTFENVVCTPETFLSEKYTFTRSCLPFLRTSCRLPHSVFGSYVKAASLLPPIGWSLSWSTWKDGYSFFLCDIAKYFLFLLQGLLTIIFIASGRPSMKFLRWEWRWWNRERFRINCRKKKEPPPMGPLECCCRWGFRNIFWNQAFQWGCCTVLH